MNPLRVLICGTNYGETYLDAIRLGGPAYKLIGILARGSIRSQKLAHDCAVPLYRCIEDLPEGIDLACAAMGTSGFDAVLKLLSRGINVLCEHPLRPGRVHAALDAASSSGVCFHLNAHFAELPATRAFIAYCRQRNGNEPVSFYPVTATDRSLYAVLDILHRLSVSFASSDIHRCCRLQPFIIIQGTLGGVPASFHLQCCDIQHPLADGSPAYLVDHRVTVGFPSGVLTLLSLNGPVIWNVNLNCEMDPRESLFTVFQEQSALTHEELHEQRVAANLGAISVLEQNMREGVTPTTQTPDYLLEASSTWEMLGSLL